MSSENRGVFVGGYTQEFLRNIRADVAIFSVQAVAADGKYYDCYAEEVAARNVMIQNSAKRILLCDSSKWNKVSSFLQGDVKDLDYVISDRDLCELFHSPTPEKYILA